MRVAVYPPAVVEPLEDSSDRVRIRARARSSLESHVAVPGDQDHTPPYPFEHEDRLRNGESRRPEPREVAVGPGTISTAVQAGQADPEAPLLDLRALGDDGRRADVNEDDAAPLGVLDEFGRMLEGGECEEGVGEGAPPGGRNGQSPGCLGHRGLRVESCYRTAETASGGPAGRLVGFAPSHDMADTRKRHALRNLGLAGILLGCALALYLAHAARVTYPTSHLGVAPDPGTWRGIFHVHTTASDGLGDIEEVVAAARATGAAWVLIADHNTMERERFRLVDGVLLVFSPEVGVPDGHATGVGLRRALSRPERRSPDALSTIRMLGGTPVAAHPLGRKRPYKHLDDPRLGGLEVISADQEFREALVDPPRLVPAVLAYLVNPMHAVMQLVRRPNATLAKWDKLLAKRRMAGYCAVDAHGRPPYDVMMRLLQMHVLVGRPPGRDAVADGVALVDGLVRGRSFCGIGGFGTPEGFRFTARTDAGDAAMGDEVALGSNPVLRLDLMYAALPETTDPHVLCGGHEVPLAASSIEGGRRYEAMPNQRAACRAEVRIRQGSEDARPWIVSNPIYIR